MTNEQKEKIIELRKLGIGYRSIATVMSMSRDKVRNFCKAQGLDGYGKNNKEAEEKAIRELCKNCGKRINQKPIKGRPKTFCSKECKKEWEFKHPIKNGNLNTQYCINMNVTTAERTLRAKLKMQTSAATNVIYEIDFGVMKILKQ